MCNLRSWIQSFLFRCEGCGNISRAVYCVDCSMERGYTEPLEKNFIYYAKNVFYRLYKYNQD